VANLYSTVGKLTRWWRGWTGSLVLAAATALLAPDVAVSSSTITLNGGTSSGTIVLGSGSLTLNGSNGVLTGNLTPSTGTLSVTLSGGGVLSGGTLGSNLTVPSGMLSGTSGGVTLTPGTSGTVVLGSGTTSGTLSLGGVLYSGVGTISITSGTLSGISGGISVVPGSLQLVNGVLFNNQADSDVDGDGLNFALEQLLGTNPNLPDSFLEGGVSRRASALTSVLLSPNYYQLTFVSSPDGIFQNSIQYASGSYQVSLPYATPQTNGYRFVGWYDSNGVRVSGRGSNQSSVVAVTGTMTFTARYVPEGVDTDLDGLADWLEWLNFGTLAYNGQSDPDADGLSIALEQLLGYQPSLADSVFEGGLSRRASAQIPVLLSASYYPVTTLSEPVGFLGSSTQFVTGSVQISLPGISAQSNGYRFAGWYQNGLRVGGFGNNQSPVVTVNAATTFTARYVLETADTDLDGLADWLEWFNFGTLAFNGASDPDSDGFSSALEQLLGYQPFLKDVVLEGGISRRASGIISNLTLQLVPVFVSSPQSLAVSNGASLYLSAEVAGVGPITYQWLRGSTQIQGATQNYLSVSQVQATDSGTYTVLATNANGTATSAPAIVTVLPVGSYALNASLVAGSNNVTFQPTYGFTLTRGMVLTGPGIPVGTTINAVSGGNMSLSMSAPATQSGSVNIIVSPSQVPSFATNVFTDLSLLNSGTSAVTVDLNPLVSGSVASVTGRSWTFAANQTAPGGTQGLVLTQNGSLSVSGSSMSGVRDLQVELSVAGTLTATGTVTLNATYPTMTNLTGTVGSPAQTINLAQFFSYIGSGNPVSWGLTRGAPPLLAGGSLTAGGTLSLPAATTANLGTNNIYLDATFPTVSGGTQLTTQTVKLAWTVSNFNAFWNLDTTLGAGSLDLSSLVGGGTLYTPPFTWSFSAGGGVAQPVSMTTGWSLTSQGLLSAGSGGVMPNMGGQLSLNAADTKGAPVLGTLSYQNNTPVAVGSLKATVGQGTISTLDLNTLPGLQGVAAGSTVNWTVMPSPLTTVAPPTTGGVVTPGTGAVSPGLYSVQMSGTLQSQPPAGTASGVYNVYAMRNVTSGSVNSGSVNTVPVVSQTQIVRIDLAVTGGSSSVIGGVNVFAGTASVTVPSTVGLAVGTPVSGYGLVPNTTIVGINGANKLTLSSTPYRSVIGTSLTVGTVLAAPVVTPPVILPSFATNVFTDLSLLNSGTSVATVDLNPLVSGTVAAVTGRSWAFSANQTAMGGTQGLVLTQNGSLSVSSTAGSGVRDLQVELSVAGTLTATGTVTLNATYPTMTNLTGTVGSPAQTYNLSQMFSYIGSGTSTSWSLTRGAPPLVAGGSLTAVGSLILPAATTANLGTNNIYLDATYPMVGGGTQLTTQTVRLVWTVSNFNAFWNLDATLSSGTLDLNPLVAGGTLYTPPFNWSFSVGQQPFQLSGWTLSDQGLLSAGSGGVQPIGYQLNLSATDAGGRSVLGVLNYQNTTPVAVGSLKVTVGQPTSTTLDLNTLPGLQAVGAGSTVNWYMMGGPGMSAPFYALNNGTLTVLPTGATASGVYNVYAMRNVMTTGTANMGAVGSQVVRVDVGVTGGSSSVINGVNLLSGTASVTVPSTTGLTAGTPVSGYGVMPGTTITSINGANKLTLSNPPYRSVFGTSLTVAGVLAQPVILPSFATNVFTDLSMWSGGTGAAGVATVDLNPLVSGSVASVTGRSWAFAANQTAMGGTQGLVLTQNGSLSVSSTAGSGVRDLQVELSVAGTLTATGTVTLNATYPSSLSVNSIIGLTVGSSYDVNSIFASSLGASPVWSQTPGTPAFPAGVTQNGGTLTFPAATNVKAGIYNLYVDALSTLAGGSTATTRTFRVSWNVLNFRTTLLGEATPQTGILLDLNSQLPNPGAFTPPLRWSIASGQMAQNITGWQLTESGTLSAPAAGGMMPLPGYPLLVGAVTGGKETILGQVQAYEYSPTVTGTLAAQVGAPASVLDLGSLFGQLSVPVGGSAQTRRLPWPGVTAGSITLIGNSLSVQPLVSTPNGVYNLYFERDIYGPPVVIPGTVGAGGVQTGSITTSGSLISAQIGKLLVTINGGTSSLLNGVQLTAGGSLVTVPDSSVLSTSIGAALSGLGLQPNTVLTGIVDPTHVSVSQPANATYLGSSLSVAGSLFTGYRPPSVLAFNANQSVLIGGSLVSLDLNSFAGGSATNWSLPSGQGLPDWVKLTPSGTLTAQAPVTSNSGSYDVYVEFTGATGSRLTARVTGDLLGAVVDLAGDSNLPGGLTLDLNRKVPATAGLVGQGSWTLLGGSIQGVALTPQGQLSVLPNTTLNRLVEARVADAAGHAYLLGIALNSTAGFAPTLTLAPVGRVQFGLPFFYQITATGNPTNFSADGLPQGLSVAATGSISGTPVQAGSFVVNVAAENAIGKSATAQLVLNVLPPPPVFGGSLAAVLGNVGEPFAYQIVTTGTVTGYLAPNLPGGLSLNVNSGSITGVPVQGGSFNQTVGAFNEGGSLTSSVNFIIKPPLPVFPGSLAAVGNSGEPFNFVVRTQGTMPSTFAPVDKQLEGFGLTLTPDGVLSGTLLAAPGTYGVAIAATNDGGVRIGTLALTVKPPLPVFVGSLAAVGNSLEPFSFRALTQGTSTFSTQEDKLPPGLTLTPDGVLSGTLLAAPGTLGVVIAATNDGGVRTGTLALTVKPQLPVFIGSLTAVGNAGEPFSFTLLTQGTSTFAPADKLPAGLALTPGGVLSGTLLAAPGTYGVALAATNDGGVRIGTLALTVKPPLPVFVGSLAAVGNSLEPFSFRVLTQGTSTFSTQEDKLPPGLKLTPDGVLSGTLLAAPGTLGVVIAATNDGGVRTGTLALTVKPTRPIYSGSLTLTATLGKSFSASLTAAVSNGPVTFVSDVLPRGLTLDKGGTLSGTPGAIGSSTLRLTLTNDGGDTFVPLNFVVLPQAPVISDQILTGTAQVGKPFSYQISATNMLATNQPLGYKAEGLPNGLSVDPVAGIITGTLVTVGERPDASVTLKAANTGGEAVATLKLTLLPAAPVITNTELSRKVLLGGTFTYQITTDVKPTAFTASPLPDTLKLNSTTGLITGSLTTTAILKINLGAVNDGGTGNALLTVEVGSPAPIITSPVAATAQVGKPFSYAITADGGATVFNGVPVLASGTLVSSGSWLTFTQPNQLSGTPTSTNPVTVNLSASSVSGGTGTAVLTIKVLPAAPVISGTLNLATVAGDVFNYQINADGSPKQYTVKGLPDGLKLDSTKGLITGAVSNGGTYAVILGAVNDGGEGNATLRINAKPSRPVISTTAVTFINNGTIQSVPLSVTGNPTSYSLLYAPWLSVSNGSITGQPLKVGFTKIQLTAMNESGSSSAIIGVTVKLPPPVITDATKTIVLGDSITYLVRALNEATSFSAAPLPDGVKFDTTTGVLQGVPTTAGSYAIGLTATNDIGSGTATLTLVVNPKRPVITSDLAVSGKSGQPFTYKILATGTGGASPFTVDSAQLQKLGVFTFDSATGVISGTLGPLAANSGGKPEMRSLTIGASNASGTTQAGLFVKVERAVATLDSFVVSGTAFAGKSGTLTVGTSATVASGSFAPTWSFASTASVPTWLRLDPSSGQLSFLAPVSLFAEGSLTSKAFTLPVQGIDDANSRVVSGTVNLVINKPLAPPSVTLAQTPSGAVNKGDNLVLSVSGGSLDSGLQFQWRRNGASLSKATSGTYSFTVNSPDDLGKYELVLTNDAGSTTSNPLTVASQANPLQLTHELTSRVVLAGGSLNWTDFAVDAGSLATGSLTYTWTRATGGSVQATGGVLSVGSVTADLADVYTVTASNGLYSVSSTGELRVFNPISTPQLSLKSGTITDGTVTFNAGQSATFVATATGGDPSSSSGKLRYQWYTSATPQGAGTAISGATTRQYTLDSVGSLATGSQYWARVSVLDPFAIGGTTAFGTPQDSARVTLAVRQAPAITVQPVPVKLALSGTVNLSVTATGTDPLVYQWFKGETALQTGTAATYSFSATESSAGSYSVTVKNVVGSVTSVPVAVAVRVPVTITQQPDSSRTVNPQATVKLRVAAKGTGTLSYQWRKGGVELSDGVSVSGGSVAGSATNTLSIDKVDVADEGDYDVVVSQVEDGTSSSVASNKSTLTVNDSVQIQTNPSDLTVVSGSAAKFAVTARGKSLKYQWRLNGGSLVESGSSFTGVNTANLTVTAASASGDYDVLVTSGAIGVASQSAHLDVLGKLSLVTDLVGATDLVPSTGQTSATYLLAPVLSSSGSLTYQWQKNGVNIVGGSGTASQYLATVTDAATDKYQVTVKATQIVGSVTLDLGTVTSSAVSLALMQPVEISKAPEAVATEIGSAASFSVTATGGGTLTYQWEKLSSDGSSTALPGATSGTYSVSEAVPDDAGSYRVKVSNKRGVAFSKYVSLSVRQKDFILTQPSAVTANPGDTATFAVTASGSGLWTLSYQWRKDGNALTDGGTVSGSKTSKLTLLSVGTASVAQYDVVVSGTYKSSSASFTSASAKLSVNTPVSIDTQPSTPVLKAGGSATLLVKVSGTPVQASGTLGFAYQWRRNGVNLEDGALFTGSKSAVLTLNAPATDTSSVSGIFDVVVTNVVGSVTSSPVTVSVLTPVVITSDPVGGTYEPYAAVQLNVTVTGSAPLTYQWRKNGVVLTESDTVKGVATDTLVISSATPASAVVAGDSGSYDVVVGNALNAATSLPAVVTVKAPPSIITQPATQTVNSGDAARFSVGVQGTAPFTYRWYKLSGGTVTAVQTTTSSETTNELALTNVTDSSEFWVEVGNNVVVGTGSLRALSAVITSSSTLVTTASTVGLSVGSHISGSGIPADTTVSALDSTGPSFTLSAAALASGTSELLANTVTSLHVKTDLILPLSLPDSDPGAAASTEGISVAPKAISPAPIVGGTLSIPYKLGLSTQAGVTIVYQWRKNGVVITDDSNITGTTTDTLNFKSVKESDEGIYDMVVSKISGGAEKGRITTRALQLSVRKPPLISGLPATLLVRPTQAISLAPTVQSGTSNLSCIWTKQGSSSLPASVSVNYSTGAFSIASASTADSGTYELTASDDNGERTPHPTVSITVADPLVVTLSQTDLTKEPRQRLDLQAIVNGTSNGSGLLYQWRFNGAPIRGAVTSTFSISSLSLTHSGSYDVVVSNGTERAISQTPCKLTVNAPWQIVTQPAATTLFNQGGTISLSVALTPSRTDLSNVKFQWLKGVGRAAQILADQTSATLTIPNAKLTDEGSYMVLITTPTGRLTSTLAHVYANYPVTIVKRDPDVSAINATSGSSVSLRVDAIGTGPFTFQWLRDGVAIPGGSATTSRYPDPVTGKVFDATTVTLTLGGVSATDAGIYQVKVMNGVTPAGVLSNSWELQVSTTATITKQPQATKLLEGRTIKLSVEATGSGILKYQWRKNGLISDGKTNGVVTNKTVNEPTLIVPNASVVDTGEYDCIVRNFPDKEHTADSDEIGRAISRSVFVQVIQPVTLQDAPVDQSVLLGGTAHFRVIAAGTPSLATGSLSFNWTTAQGVPLTNSGSVNIVSTPTASDLYVTSGSAGTVGYKVTVTGAQPDATTATAGVPVILVDGSSVLAGGTSKLVGGTVTLTVGTSAGTGTNLSYEWFKVSKQPISVGSSNAAGATIADATVVNGGTLKYLSATQTASFYAVVTGSGTVQTEPATVLVNSKAFTLTTGSVASSGPVITTQPLSRSVGPNEDAVLSVTVAGSGTYSYAWYKIGTTTSEITSGTVGATVTSSGTSSALRLTNAKADREGLYYVTVTDAAQTTVQTTVNSQAALVYVNAANPLGMDAQGVVANEGDDVTLRTFAIGDGLTYQWSKDGVVDLATTNTTARSANLVLGTIAGGSLVTTGTVSTYHPGDDGTYKVTLSSGTQQLVTGTYTVVVIRKPQIVKQPVTQNRLPGETATLSAEMVIQTIGTETPGYSNYQWMLAPRYQWYFRRNLTEDWAPVPGAIKSTYTVPSVTSADAGYYHLEASNNAGTSVSEAAQVHVFTPVSVSIASGTVQSGTLTLTASVTGDLAEPAASAFQWFKQVGSTYTAIGSLNIGTLSTGSLRSTDYTGATLTITGVKQTDGVFYKVRALGKVLVKAPDIRYADSVPFKVTLAKAAFGAGVNNATTSLVKGDSAVLKVNVVGSNLEARWYKLGTNSTWSPIPNLNWIPLNGATVATYSKASVEATDSGTYGLALRNQFSTADKNGSVETLKADSAIVPREVGVLLVRVPPTATLASSSVKALAAGATLSLSGTITDVAGTTVQYQWRKDGQLLTGTYASGRVVVGSSGTADLGAYTTSSGTVSGADEGIYDVVVANAYGSSTSNSTRVVMSPVIVTQPKSVISSDGGSATFLVDATGVDTLSYQWERKSLSETVWKPVGAGQSVLTLKGLTYEGDSGAQFRVTVTSGSNSVLSGTASLTVSPAGAVTFTSQPNLPNLGGATIATLQPGVVGGSLLATGSESTGVASLNYQWRKDGVNLTTTNAKGSVSGVNKAFGFALSLGTISSASEGVYDLVVDNGATFVTSNAFVLTVDPKIQSFTVPASVNQGDGVTLRVGVRSSVSPTFNWSRTSGGTYSLVQGGTSDSLTIPKAATTDSGTYKVDVLLGGTVVATTDSKTMTVISPVSITGQPSNQSSVTPAEGSSLSLTVTASGGDPTQAGGGLSYVWTKDGVALAGGSSSTLTVGSLKVTDSGVYQVKVSNAFSFALSNPVTVTVAQKLGVSLVSNVSVKSGEGVSLVPTITGSDATMTLQWSKNGSKILSGGTSDQYRIASATDADAGVYTLVATKGKETASASVTVNVLKLPEILAAPVSRIILGGSSATAGSVTFSVAARSNDKLLYVWKKNGKDDTVGTGAAIRVPGTVASAGTYTVAVSNSIGTVSLSATLTVVTSATDTGLSQNNAGSTGDPRAALFTNYWVYAVDLADALGVTHRSGYWMLERVKNAAGVVSTGTSAWIVAPATISSGSLQADKWLSTQQYVQDSADSASKADFSVVAYRTAAENGTLADDEFTISGRVESAGAAAFFGAPDSMAGDYAQGDAALSWDTELVNVLQVFTDFNSAADQVKQYLTPQAAQRASALGD
jgi:hypothetical protein